MGQKVDLLQILRGGVFLQKKFADSDFLHTFVEELAFIIKDYP